MATIIAGGFDVFSKTQWALQRLREAGVQQVDICEFRINPAGEHGQSTVEHPEEPGAKHAEAGAGAGAAIGAAIGAVVGIAGTPLLGPAAIVAGAGAGSYTGSLVGSLGQVDTEPQPDQGDVRPAEAMIAVNTDAGPISADEVIRIFYACGAHQVERAQGVWATGKWQDFDPLSRPHLVGASVRHSTDSHAPGTPTVLS